MRKVLKHRSHSNLWEFRILVLVELLNISPDKCAEEPRFCLNGATCAPTWTSARCHCGDRYQGNRCDTCAAGYYGETCGNSIVSFCIFCIFIIQVFGNEAWHGELHCVLDYVFMERLGHNCLPGNDPQITPGNNAKEIEACKEVCARNQQYGGFVVYNKKCVFKPPHCKNDVYPDGVDLYLKETVEV